MRPGTATNVTNPSSSASQNNLPRVSTAPSKSNNFGAVGNSNPSSTSIGVTFASNTLAGFDSLSNNHHHGFDDFLNNTASSMMMMDNGERTPLSNAIESTLMTVKMCEANVASLSERLIELQQNLIKSKQLENEIGPREGETKNAVAAFQRLVEVSTKIKKGAKKRGGGGDTHDGDENGNNNHNNNNNNHDDSESQVSRSEAGTNPADNNNKNNNSNGNNPNGRSRYGLNLLAGKDGDLSKEEIADRDAIRHLSQKIRGILTPVFSEIFFQDSTTRENQKAAFLQQQADEQAARESMLASAAAAGNDKNARASRRAQQQQQQATMMMLQQQQQQSNNNNKTNGASLPGTFNPLFDRIDPDLYLIPGMDPSFFQDLLNLRQTRLVAERALKKTQEQLSTAQGIIAKRRSDGSNKTALRKAEKQLQQATAALRELQRQREERDIRKRLEAAAIADDNGVGGSGYGGGGGGAGGSNGSGLNGAGGNSRSGGASLRKPPTSNAASSKRK